MSEVEISSSVTKTRSRLLVPRLYHPGTKVYGVSEINIFCVFMFPPSSSLVMHVDSQRLFEKLVFLCVLIVRRFKIKSIRHFLSHISIIIDVTLRIPDRFVVHKHT